MRKTVLATIPLVAMMSILAAPPGTAATTTASLHRDANCADFSTQAAAQNYFIAHGGPSSDPDGLDADHDGIACESNPCPCSTSTGGGGGGGGGGNTPPVKTEKACGKFVGIPGSRVCLKMVTQGGKLKKVEDFRFRGLPADCGGGKKPKIAGKDSKIGGDGSKFRSRHPKVLGGFSAVNAKIVGKVTSAGKKAHGEVRVRARSNAGAACDTRGRKWKAS